MMDLCSIKSCFLVVGMGGDVYISRSGILGLAHFFGGGIALLDDFLLFLQVLLGHFMQVETVDFGVVSRYSLLQGIDGRSIEPILDKLQSSPSKSTNLYSSVCQSSGSAVTKAV